MVYFYSNRYKNYKRELLFLHNNITISTPFICFFIHLHYQSWLKFPRTPSTRLFIMDQVHKLIRACGLVVWFSLWATSWTNRKTKHARGPGFNSQLAPLFSFLDPKNQLRLSIFVLDSKDHSRIMVYFLEFYKF